jgi:hypothetical protein
MMALSHQLGCLDPSLADTLILAHKLLKRIVLPFAAKTRTVIRWRAYFLLGRADGVIE